MCEACGCGDGPVRVELVAEEADGDPVDEAGVPA